MAEFVPPIEIVDKFAAPLTAGERALMNALAAVLDDSWTIYVQPFLNGVSPDIIILSEESGMGLFEVKDWNLNLYSVSRDGEWSVETGGDQTHRSTKRCPLRQVEKYRESLFRYTLPELGAQREYKKGVNAIVSTFVYFHCHTTSEALQTIAPIEDDFPYTTVFGRDALHPPALLNLLRQRNLTRSSRFAYALREDRVRTRLRNMLAYPEHGQLKVDDILFELDKKQSDLLVNAKGKRRVLGSAGSGKTILLIRKAVNAAKEGKRVLLVCYNITMSNHLDEMVRRLARHYDTDYKQITRNILVWHYHRLFEWEAPKVIRRIVPDVVAMMPFTVMLVDEGQDFERDWINKLYTMGEQEDFHFMFVEDDRQNIYGHKDRQQQQDGKVRRRVVPGILGRPNELNRSYRITTPTARLSNRFIQWRKEQFESPDVTVEGDPQQRSLFEAQLPEWRNGTAEEMLQATYDKLDALIHTEYPVPPADVVILVANIEDGWKIWNLLSSLRLRPIATFESRAENEHLRKIGKDDKDIEKVRRGRKVAFRMGTGRIKIATIHSFKGWELGHVILYFAPNSYQKAHATTLFYTALTRAQKNLYIFNADPDLIPFGELAIEEGLAQ